MAILLPAPGHAARREDLRSDRAKSLVEYLASSNATYASLVEVRVNEHLDSVVIELDIQRPQKCVYPIAAKEVLAIVFDAVRDLLPNILALREDFPLVPHINRTQREKPRSLCLYDETWEQVRLSWTAAGFIRRVRTWLADTAVGALHRQDQALEPFLMPSRHTLIVPANLDITKLGSQAEIMDIQAWGERTFVALPLSAQKLDSGYLLFALAAPPRSQGVISRTPLNMKELHDLLDEFGLNLAEALRSKIVDWKTATPKNYLLQLKPILLVVFPKRRDETGPVETTEYDGFLFSSKTVEDIGIALEVLSKDSGTGFTGILLAPPSTASLESIEIAAVPVLTGLTREAAAALNGTAAFAGCLTAIGVGALGSQILNNLVRSGFGKWKIIDSDIFYPHNGARHLFMPNSAGATKAEIMQGINACFEWETVIEGSSRDVLTLDAAEFTGSVAIFDFSASLPVSRYLAHLSGLCTRCASVFITPEGHGLVILMEDKSRHVTIDWLEMLHYREVLHNPLAVETLTIGTHRRYGNGCRDLSAVLSQDDVALWASTASRALKQLTDSQGPSLMLWRRDALTGSVQSGTVSLNPHFSVKMGDWTVVYDDWFCQKLSSLRLSKLPNETGGVLIGHFDVHYSFCYLIDALPSPADSVEWPTAYYRGVAGLRDAVLSIEEKTLGQVTYIGEWHSHPDGVTTNPSNDDLTAHLWLQEYMNAESLPALMAIIGENSEFRIVAVEPL
ncbi:MAG: Mov34/MPN/PAD-1 family protein [Chthoniobacterales bacterium]